MTKPKTEKKTSSSRKCRRCGCVLKLAAALGPLEVYRCKNGHGDSNSATNKSASEVVEDLRQRRRANLRLVGEST